MWYRGTRFSIQARTWTTWIFFSWNSAAALATVVFSATSTINMLSLQDSKMHKCCGVGLSCVIQRWQGNIQISQRRWTQTTRQIVFIVNMNGVYRSKSPVTQTPKNKKNKQNNNQEQKIRKHHTKKQSLTSLEAFVSNFGFLILVFIGTLVDTQCSNVESEWKW